eukprot:10329942-Ditylum_brightwellii.AAC.1
MIAPFASVSSISLRDSKTSMSSIHSDVSIASKRDHFQNQKNRLSNISFGLVSLREMGSEDNSNPLHESNDCCMTLEGHTAAVLSLATTNHAYICFGALNIFTHVSVHTHYDVQYAGSADKTARLWCIDTGVCLRVFHGHLGAVNAVTALDETMILTASRDRTVKLWDALNGNEENTKSAACLRTYVDHKNEVTCVTHCHDGKTFLTGSRDLKIKMWNITSVSLPPSLQAVMEEHQEFFEP